MDFRFSIKLIFILLLVFGKICVGFAQTHKNTGAIPYRFDSAMTKPKSYPISRGDRLPTSFSLRQYCPPAGNQGSLGSCSAWATAYAGFTIIKRIENGSSNTPVFSPYCQYARYKAKSYEDPCSDGAYTASILGMLKESGCDVISNHGPGCDYEPASRTFQSKLYDYDFINTSTYDIKRALLEKQPVVISIKSYGHTGWESESNFTNNIWNGSFDAEKHDGFHAMCIVGYDDYASDGAFLVMNSWGEGWGDDGFFWLRYKDIYHISDAFAMVPDPYRIVENDVESDDSEMEDDSMIELSDDDFMDDPTPGSRVKFSNDCMYPIFVSLAKHVNNGWHVEGWWLIEPNESIQLNIDDRNRNEIYWCAITEQKYGLRWFSDTQNTDNTFCYSPTSHYEYLDGLWSSNDEEECATESFHKKTPDDWNDVVYLSIICPRNTARGGSDKPAMGFQSLKLAAMDSEAANKEWSSGNVLIDLSDGKPIIPRTDGIYELWYTDGRSKPVQKSCTAMELESLKAFKFNTLQNAQHWLKWKNK